MIRKVYLDVNEFKAQDAELQTNLPYRDAVDALRQEAVIADHVIHNRLVCQPMEGCDGTAVADVLGNLERISDHCSNLAVAVIEESQDRFDAHSYLESRKAADPRFQGEYDRFAEKYAL